MIGWATESVWTGWQTVKSLILMLSKPRPSSL